MNPLKHNNFNMPTQNNMPTNNISPQMAEGIQRAKVAFQAFNGNPQALMQQFPQIGQVMQMGSPQQLQNIFMQECQRQGIDPNVILNGLRN